MIPRHPSVVLHVTPTQAARKLGLSRSTIYRMIDTGILNPHVRLFKTLIPLDEITRLLARRALK